MNYGRKDSHFLAQRMRVVGRVQGVGFRYFVLDKAEALGVTGWVRNCPDGSVEVHAEGTVQQLDALAAFCEKGPDYSRVHDLQKEVIERSNYQNFQVIF